MTAKSQSVAPAKPANKIIPKPDPQAESQQRIRLMKYALLVCFAAVAARLLYIQVIRAPHYQEVARKQYEAPAKLLAARGIIYDRNARMLVSNSMLNSFAADPESTRSRASHIADVFSRVFGRPREFYLPKLTAEDRRFVWLERKTRQDQADRVLASKLPGIMTRKEPDRVYHYDEFAGQLLGFTDIDSNGIAGIERQFDAQLKGRHGFMILQRDGRANRSPFATVDYPRVEPANGHNLVLTIDLDYQSIAEDELRKGIERTGAESGLVVMLEPATGEVLAMASAPGVNPNHPATVQMERVRNRVINDVFEPGSVFKIVTASAALEHSIVKPEDKFYAEKGTYLVPLPGGRKRKIQDVHPYGIITFRQAMELSSNIVMAKVSDRIGAELMYTTARNFGFGTITGIELPGELSGKLKKPVEWSGTTLNTIAYGYEVTITPLQIAAAYAAVANGGMLMKPFVVRQILDEHNEVIAETPPEKIRQVISRATADTLKGFLAGVVERGTGTAAKLDGLTVAGKTGTSKKHIEGKYSAGDYTASFVGFFPAEDPHIVCLVMLDNPRVGGYYGGQASAPIFRAIAQKVVSTSERFTRKARITLPGASTMVVPDVTTLDIDAAESSLKSLGFAVEIRGEGKIVVRQSPAPGTKLARGEKVEIVTQGNGALLVQGYTVVPDVRGLSIRRALNRLTMAQLDVAVQGSGTVVGQSPSAGEQVKPGTRIVMRCQPKSMVIAAAN